MFDFEKLEVNHLIEETNRRLLTFLFKSQEHDKYLFDQLKRSCISIALNLAEGVGRMSPADKRHFYVMARGSLNETVALLKIFKELNWIPNEEFKVLYENFESISKMLLGMIRSTQKRK